MNYLTGSSSSLMRQPPFTYFLWMLKIYYVKIEAGRKIIYKFTKEKSVVRKMTK